MSHTYAYTRMHSYIYTHIHTYMHTYMHTHMQTCTHDIYFIFLFRRPHAHGMIPGQPVHQPEHIYITGHRGHKLHIHLYIQYVLPGAEVTSNTFIVILQEPVARNAQRIFWIEVKVWVRLCVTVAEAGSVVRRKPMLLVQDSHSKSHSKYKNIVDIV